MVKIIREPVNKSKIEKAISDYVKVNFATLKLSNIQLQEMSDNIASNVVSDYETTIDYPMKFLGSENRKVIEVISKNICIQDRLDHIRFMYSDDEKIFKQFTTLSKEDAREFFKAGLEMSNNVENEEEEDKE
jgi:hypothetical protein